MQYAILVCFLFILSTSGLFANEPETYNLEAESIQPKEAGLSVADIDARPTEDTPPLILPADPIYPVSQFLFDYGNDHPELPSLLPISDLTVTLSINKDGVYVPPQQIKGQPTLDLKLGKLAKTSQFSLGALREVLSTILQYWNDEDFYGAYVLVDTNQIDPQTGGDKRSSADTTLRLVNWFSEIDRLRTLAYGFNIDEEPAINSEDYARFIDNSPLQAAEGDKDGDVIRKSVLEDYLLRLNRHPGRQANASIASSDSPGGVELDLLINENKPYILYSQFSNNGTESTGEWRARGGFIHNQLTDNDDIFSLEYITTNWGESNAVVGSYQRPIIPHYLKWRTYGSWNEFDADDVGILDSEFSGLTKSLGLELISSPFTVQDFYIDFFAGARWSDIKVDNETLNQEGNGQTFMPYIGTAISRRRFIASTYVTLSLEGNINNIDEQERIYLGRLDTTDDWVAAKFDASANFYLEPLFSRSSWRDQSTWRSSTIANEVSMRVRGQQTLGDKRIIPQEELIMGGANSVRGYPESVAAGDDGMIATFQYRLHVPRLLTPYSELEKAGIIKERLFGKYNLRPPAVHQLPDWDFVLKGFVDYGVADINEERDADQEADFKLFSAGVGVELQYLSRFNMSLDWGRVLSSLKRNGTPIDNAQQGDSRLHFSLTLSW